MKPDTLKALDESIAHWEKNAKTRSKLESSVYGDECALCERFDRDDKSCERTDGEKCPVYIATGIPRCEGSPYERAASIWFSVPLDEPLPQPAWTDAANAEVAFLQSLRPSDES